MRRSAPSIATLWFPHSPPLVLRGLGLGHVWLAAPIALALLAAGSLPAEGIDLWWCLLLGTRAVGAPDPVVFTPLVNVDANVQWLAETALATLYGLGGLGLLLVIRTLLVTLTIGLVQVVALRAGASQAGAGRAAMLALPLVVAGASLRPQLLALPLFPLILLLGGPLARWRWSFAAAALISALWANLHGSFALAPISLLVLGLAGGRADLHRRLGLALSSLLATCFNPWGPALYLSALATMRANALGGAGQIALEWRPLDPLTLVGLVYMAEVVAVAVGVFRRQRSALVWLALTLPLGLMAAAGVRHTTWFALAATPLAAFGLGRPSLEAPGRPLLNGALVSLLALIGMFGLSRPFLDTDRQLVDSAPLRLSRQLAAMSPARVFNFSDWGGFLAWQLKPDTRMFIDDRFEQHPDEVWAQYRQISLAEPGWEQVLDQERIDVLALDPDRQSRLLAAADGSASWRLAYRDGHGRIYVRR